MRLELPLYVVSWMMICGFEDSFWWYHTFIDSLDLTQIKAATPKDMGSLRVAMEKRLRVVDHVHDY